MTRGAFLNMQDRFVFAPPPTNRRRWILILFSALILTMGFHSPGLAALLSAEDRKQYEIAFRAMDAGRWDVVFNHAARPSERLPAKAIEWLHLQRSDTTANFAEIAQFVAENPSWPRLDRLKARAETVMTDVLPDTVILAWFRDNPPTTGAGFFLYVNALERAGMTAMLTAEVQRAWLDLNMSASDEHAFRQRFHHQQQPVHRHQPA